MIVDFHKGNLPPHSLNFGTRIILLAKGSDAKQIKVQPDMSIECELCSKIFTKVVTNRVLTKC
jgi:DNA-directed RNA polymerase subunit RPC12/RpoP